MNFCCYDVSPTDGQRSLLLFDRLLSEEDKSSSPQRWDAPVVVEKVNAAADLQGFHRVPPPLLPGHRRLTARATVTMAPTSIRKGSQVFRNPAQLDQAENSANMFQQVPLQILVDESPTSNLGSV